MCSVIRSFCNGRMDAGRLSRILTGVYGVGDDIVQALLVTTAAERRMIPGQFEEAAGLAPYNIDVDAPFNIGGGVALAVDSDLSSVTQGQRNGFGDGSQSTNSIHPQVPPGNAGTDPRFRRPNLPDQMPEHPIQHVEAQDNLAAEDASE